MTPLLSATETKETAAGAVTEATGRVHDGLERLSTETRYEGKLVGYGYDLKGNRTLVRDPDGVETTYGFDAQDRLTAVTTPAGTATHRYRPDGLLRQPKAHDGLLLPIAPLFQFSLGRPSRGPN